MKITKKIISILLALTMTLGMMIPAFALLPDSSESEGNASETVIVPVEFKDILSLDGKFELDDPNGIVKDFQVDYPTEWGGTNPANGKFIYYTDGKNAKTIVLTFKVTLTDDVAKNCSTAKIIINYNYTTKSVPTETSKTHTVTIELKVVVNYTALNAAIAKAEALNEKDYQQGDGKWAAMQTALANAKALVNNTIYQADVDAATVALNKAIDALIKLNYTALNAAITEAENLKASDYLTDSWEAMQVVLAQAKALVGNATTQQQIDDMAAALITAMGKLLTPTDVLNYSVLKAYISYISTLDGSIYTPDSWNALQSATNAAKALIGNALNQAQINNMVALLDKALESLLKILDYSELNAEIAKAEALVQKDYTAASFANMQNVLAAAKNLVNKANTQDEINAATTALKDAVAALVDVTDLNELLADAGELDEDDYTTSSWANLIATIAKTASVLNNGTQAQVNAAQADVQAAIDALVNVSGLKVAIAKGEAIKNTGYTEESWNALQTAIAAGKTLLDVCTQEQADSEEIAILAAIDALVEPAGVQPPVGPFDYEELKAAIAAAKAIADDNYTASSWNAFQAAISAADAIVDKATDEAQITAALDALVKAQAALVKVAPTFNYDALNAAIDSTAALVATDYTAESWAELMKALGAAEALVGKAASQDEVDAATAALKAAIKGLKLAPEAPTPDYDALYEAIKAARKLDETKYTAETWADLMKALGAAEAVNGMAATQDEIDAACEALKAATKALKEKPAAPALNYADLNAAINAVKALKAADYTAETWADLMKALGAAEAVNGNAATQQEITDATNALNAAKNALKKPTTINYTALQNAINDFGKLNKNNYSADAWASIQAVVEAAKAINGKAASQSQVDAVVAAYNAAKAATLKPVAIDYAELNAQIAVANGLKQADYTAATWQEVQSALNAAKALVNKAKTQSEADVAAYALKDAIASLVKVAPTMNTTELDNQLQIAQGLAQKDYTAATWAAVAAALEAAEEAKAGTDQAAIDNAAKALKDAMAGLVKMNFSALQDALNAVNTHAGNKEISGIWNEMHALLVKAQELMLTGDQAAVDQCVADLAAKLAEIEAEVEKLEKVEQVEVKVEVPVEPTDPYCNKGAHTVWIILMWVSVAINVAAVALVVTYFVLKKKKEGDETPLVEYDIDDDAETDDKE